MSGPASSPPGTPSRQASPRNAHQKSGSSSPSAALPSLLRKSHLSTASATLSLSTTASTSSALTTDWTQRELPSRVSSPGIEKATERRLKRAVSSASLSRPQVVRVEASASTLVNHTPPAVLTHQSTSEEKAEESDSSGELASLVHRVTGGLSSSPSPGPQVKSEKARGKEKEEYKAPVGEGVNDGPDEPGLLATTAENGLELEDDDDISQDEEDEVLIGKEEAREDPREMLREQLRRTESRGKVKRRDTDVSTTSEAHTKKLESISLEAPIPRSNYAPRRYFILSTAGKLVFTNGSDDEEATGFVGVMQAIISIFADEGDRLRYVNAGSTRIAFLLKPPLYLVCVSEWGEPEPVLRTHLEYLYLQVLSVVTQSQLSAIFARRSNFDLRRLMEGTEGFFNHLCDTLQISLPILTSSLEVYRIEPSTREEIAKVLAPGKVDELLYALVLAHGRVVTLIRPRKHSVHPSDLHLLLSTISSSQTLLTPQSDHWIPICLPRFNAKGFLHAYISFETEGVGVVFVSGDREGFAKCKELGEAVKKRLRKEGWVHRLEKAKVKQDYSLGELAVPGVRHFVYKSKALVQITAPAFEGDYLNQDAKYRLITLYQKVHEVLHPRPVASSSSNQTSRSPAKLIYLRTEHEAVLGWTTAHFELYLAVSPLLPQTAVVSAARAVTRWVKQEEASLMLTSAPSF